MPRRCTIVVPPSAPPSSRTQLPPSNSSPTRCTRYLPVAASCVVPRSREGSSWRLPHAHDRVNVEARGYQGGSGRACMPATIPVASYGFRNPTSPCNRRRRCHVAARAKGLEAFVQALCKRCGDFQAEDHNRGKERAHGTILACKKAAAELRGGKRATEVWAMSTLYSSHAARKHQLIRVVGRQGSESTYPSLGASETRHRGIYLHSVRPLAPLEKALKGRPTWGSAPADHGVLQTPGGREPLLAKQVLRPSRHHFNESEHQLPARAASDFRLRMCART